MQTGQRYFRAVISKPSLFKVLNLFYDAGAF